MGFVIQATPPVVLSNYVLPAGKSVVREVVVEGCSEAEVHVSGRRIAPGEIVNVGVRFGPVGDEPVGDHVIIRPMPPTMIVGSAVLKQTVMVRGPRLFLSLENRTDHKVTISAWVRPGKKVDVSAITLLQSHPLKAGETATREVKVSGFAAAGVEIVVAGEGRNYEVKAHLRTCPAGFKPPKAVWPEPEKVCEISQSLPKPGGDGKTRLGRLLTVYGDDLVIELENQGPAPVVVNASAYLTK
jgi:hypothetical protein